MRALCLMPIITSAVCSTRWSNRARWTTFDVGQDTGTPVLEEYESKMPFPFTGTLTKLAVVLEPDKLSDDERRRLHEELAKALEAVQ